MVGVVVVRVVLVLEIVVALQVGIEYLFFFYITSIKQFDCTVIMFVS